VGEGLSQHPAHSTQVPEPRGIWRAEANGGPTVAVL
jgi:hypothetical protein